MINVRKEIERQIDRLDDKQLIEKLRPEHIGIDIKVELYNGERDLWEKTFTEYLATLPSEEWPDKD